MTPQELLQDTIAYYSVNPAERRCRSLYSCNYSPIKINKPLSEGCAIGRHLDEDVKIKFDNYYDIKSINFEYPDIFALAPQWMQDMDIDFLQAIQNLHDYSDYWGETGLSEFGKERVDEIKEKFGL